MNVRSLLCCATLVVCAAFSVDADTESERVALGRFVNGDLQVGPKMDARGQHLRDSEFVALDLTGADFSDCDLAGVTFKQCVLRHAKFVSSSMTDAVILDCDIIGADFTDAVVNGMKPVRKNPDTLLSEEQLITTHSYKTKDLRDCNISGMGSGKLPPNYDFRGANLIGAKLSFGSFTRSDFTGAEISGMTLCRCRIHFEQLQETLSYSKRRGLTDVEFSGVKFFPDFSSLSLRRAKFYGVRDDVSFADSDITDCSFAYQLNWQQLAKTKNAKRGDLTNMLFNKIDFEHADLSRMNLTGTDFSGSKFSGANLTDAVITKTDFGNAEGLTRQQIESTWNFKQSRMEHCILPDDLAKEMLRTD
ncbi:pentapeptide repeat-containing protein [Planctomycetota bacterium]